MKNSSNKDMASVETKHTKQSFFFSGGLEYKPMSVEADTQEEALKVWEQNRIKNN